MGIQNKKFLASILFVLISFVSIAQIGNPPPPTPPPPPPGAPIDEALPILFIVAVCYGIIRKIKLVK